MRQKILELTFVDSDIAVLEKPYNTPLTQQLQEFLEKNPKAWVSAIASIHYTEGGLFGGTTTQKWVVLYVVNED